MLNKYGAQDPTILDIYLEKINMSNIICQLCYSDCIDLKKKCNSSGMTTSDTLSFCMQPHLSASRYCIRF